MDPIYSPRLRVRVIRQSSSGSVLVIYVNILSNKTGRDLEVSLPHLTTTGLITDSFTVICGLEFLAAICAIVLTVRSGRLGERS